MHTPTPKDLAARLNSTRRENQSQVDDVPRKKFVRKPHLTQRPFQQSQEMRNLQSQIKK